MAKTCYLCGNTLQPCADYDFCSSECECEYMVAIGLH